MNKFVYFLAAGLAFTVLQVATAAADHEAGHMPPPTTAAGTPPMCPGPLGTMIPCPAPGDGGPPPCPEGTVCDDPCISLETRALKDACYAEHSDEHGTSGGDSGDRDREANQEEQERQDRDRERTEREESGR